MKNAGYINRTLVALALVACAQLHALEPLDDEAMSNNIGGSTAWILEAFKIQTTPSGGSLEITITGTGTTQSGTIPVFIQAQNLNFGAVTGLTGYAAVTQTTPTYNAIANWGTATDPFLLKAYTPTGTQSLSYTGVNVANPTLLLRLPSADTAGGGNLKMGAEMLISGNLNGTSQTIGGRLYTPLRLTQRMNDFSLNGTQLSVFQTTIPGAQQHEIDNNGTIGITGIIRLNSANPATAADRTTGGVLRLSVGGGNEGVYIQNLDVNLPIGQLHYQPLTVRKGAGSNLVFELMRIPNNPAVYRRFYGSGADNVIGGTITPNPNNTTFVAPVAGTEKYNALCTSTFCGTPNLPATHGSVSVGNITFRSAGATSTTGNVDVGSVNVSGLLINHLKLTTTGL